MTLHDTDTVARMPKLAQREFEETMLVITPRDSMLHRFNTVGTFLWQCLERPATIETLYRRVRENFDTSQVDDTSVREDINHFVSVLHERSLVEIAMQPSTE